MPSLNEVINSLEYHPLNGDQVKGEKFDTLRTKAIELATTICQVTPPSREQSLAYTHLEETLMWAIKSIAIRDEPEPEPEQAEQP